MAVLGTGFTQITCVPAPADIIVGFLSHTASAGPSTLLTVPAGRTWIGTLAVAVAVDNAGANAVEGRARAVIATAGTGVVPAAGTIFACEAKAGANVLGGTVGSQGNNKLEVRAVVQAPAGNAVTLTLTSTIAGTAGVVDASAIGENQNP